MPSGEGDSTKRMKRRDSNSRQQSKQRSWRMGINASNLSRVFRHLRFLGFLCSLLFAFLGSGRAASPTFEKDIRPILKAHCFECHGEGEKLKGGLDLRLRRLMLKGGDDGPVIFSGHAEKSLLFKAVDSGEMPKRDKKLTREQMVLIKQWIDGGAKTARP